MKQIEGSDKDWESICRYTITALSSGPNAKINSFIDHLNDDNESQAGANKVMDWRDIIDAAQVKYNDMDSFFSQRGTIDPLDAKQLALATRVKTLKATQSSSGRRWKGEGADEKEKIGGVAKGCTVKHKHESCEWSGTT